jgi:hypothetical protein
MLTLSGSHGSFVVLEQSALGVEARAVDPLHVGAVAHAVGGNVGGRVVHSPHGEGGIGSVGVHPLTLLGNVVDADPELVLELVTGAQVLSHPAVVGHGVDGGQSGRLLGRGNGGMDPAQRDVAVSVAAVEHVGVVLGAGHGCVESCEVNKRR